jgi:hypothetical protein
MTLCPLLGFGTYEKGRGKVMDALPTLGGSDQIRYREVAGAGL